MSGVRGLTAGTIAVLYWACLGVSGAAAQQPLPATSSAAAQTTVTALEIVVTGKWRKTRPAHLKKAFATEVGAPFKPDVFDRDIQRVRDFGIFRTVTSTVEPHPGGVDLTVYVQDIWTIMPVFEPAFGGDVFVVPLGVRFSNFLGLNQDLSLAVQPVFGTFVTDVSASMSWTDRQFFTFHTLSAAAGRGVTEFRLAATDPAAGRVLGYYERVEHAGSVGFSYRRHPWIQPFVSIFVAERTDRLVGFSRGVTPGVQFPRRDTLLRVRPTIGVRFGRVFGYRFLSRGTSLSLSAFREWRPQGGPNIRGGQGVLRSFWLPTPRLNLGARLRVAKQSPTPPIDQLSAGGFASIRGFPNSFFRGRKLAVLNTELRGVLAEDLWEAFYLEAAAFVDTATAGNASLFGAWQSPGASVGVGLRGSFVRASNNFLRVDVAVPVTHRDDPSVGGVGLNVGVFQFF